jgi:hypothetical protein
MQRIPLPLTFFLIGFVIYNSWLFWTIDVLDCLFYWLFLAVLSNLRFIVLNRDKDFQQPNSLMFHTNIFNISLLCLILFLNLINGLTMAIIGLSLIISIYLVFRLI